MATAVAVAVVVAVAVRRPSRYKSQYFDNARRRPAADLAA